MKRELCPPTRELCRNRHQSCVHRHEGGFTDRGLANLFADRSPELPLKRELCPPTRELCPTTRELCPPTRGLCPPTPELCPSNTRAVSSDTRAVSSDTRAVSSDTRAVPSDSRAVSSDTRDVSTDTRLCLPTRELSSRSRGNRNHDCRFHDLYQELGKHVKNTTCTLLNLHDMHNQDVGHIEKELHQPEVLTEAPQGQSADHMVTAEDEVTDKWARVLKASFHATLESTERLYT